MDEKDNKCSGVPYKRDFCLNPVKWKVKGLSARFGVALTTYHCDSCKNEIEKRFPKGVPKIMEYNRKKPEFIRITDVSEA